MNPESNLSADPTVMHCAFTADWRHYSDPSACCDFEVTAKRGDKPCCGYHYISGGRLFATARR